MPENEGSRVGALRMDVAFPGNPTAVRELEASHSPFLSVPDQVAGIVLDALG